MVLPSYLRIGAATSQSGSRHVRPRDNLSCDQMQHVLQAVDATSGTPANEQLIVSHMEPFGARLVLEKIQCSAPVSVNRTMTFTPNGTTTYMPMLLNQRTVPL
jgi:hypothetical protein